MSAEMRWQMHRTVKCGNQLIGTRMPRICIPIMGMTQAEIMKQLDQILEKPFDIIEWRMDYFDLVEDLHACTSILTKIKERIGSRLLLATFRSANEGGVRDMDSDQYETLLRYLFRNRSADLLDVEWQEHSALLEEFSGELNPHPVILASYHNYNETESMERMLFILNDMQKKGADILKIAMMPHKEEDALQMMSAGLQRKKVPDSNPYILLSMGDIGKVTRLTGELTGSCITFANGIRASAPGQMDVELMKKTLLELRIGTGQHIYLTGFMGTGKSTIAGLLAERMNLDWIDTDAIIEEKEGMAITELFGSKGEGYFREAETKLLRGLSEEHQMIISCGGGIILREENVRYMKQNGIVVCLQASPETVYSRVCGDDTRPMLNSDMSIDHIRNLMELRQKRYDAAADFALSTDGYTPKEVVDQIVKWLETEG